MHFVGEPKNCQWRSATEIEAESTGVFTGMALTARKEIAARIGVSGVDHASKNLCTAAFNKLGDVVIHTTLLRYARGRQALEGSMAKIKKTMSIRPASLPWNGSVSPASTAAVKRIEGS
jgi:hypothetical protein